MSSDSTRNNDNDNSPLELTRDELAWQAHLFVAGELAGADHDKFVELLGRNQDAREAVALAVETTLAAKCVLGEHKRTGDAPTVSASNSGRRGAGGTVPLYWLAATCCIVALATVGSFILRHDLQGGDRQVSKSNKSEFPNADNSNAELARAWNETLLDWKDGENLDELMSLEEEHVFSDVDGEDVANADGLSRIDEPTIVPSWMEVAVSGSSGSKMSETPEADGSGMEMPASQFDSMPAEGVDSQSGSNS